ncbi:hypothetical protein FQN57_001433 [Myotisia sp. PD_48]|nr:hypothetical protein FQN57_001433 [Myotisia sp. PD_48]
MMAENLTSFAEGISHDDVFDLLLPGFGLLSRIFSTFFHVELAEFLPPLLLIGLAVTVFRYSADSITSFITRHLTSSVTVQIEEEAYRYVMYWIIKQGFCDQSTNIMATINAGCEPSSYVDTDSDNEDEEDSQIDTPKPGESFEGYWERTSQWEKIQPLYFVPWMGIHRFWYKGRLVTVHRSKDEGKGWWTETMSIACLGRSTGFLKEFLRDAQQAYIKRDSGKTIIYRWAKAGDSTTLSWNRCMTRHPRPLSSVILDNAQKDEFLADMKDYLHPYTKRWYSNRGIPYRRGYLFSGPPGCGKTSLCFAVAGQLGLKIYVANLSSRNLTEDALINLFASLPSRCIILLEDIDAAGITKNRSKAQPAPVVVVEPETDKSSADSSGTANTGAAATPVIQQGITLSTLLNTIDGVASSEGRILIMTTNHEEDLDPALLRPGRVDMSIRFTRANTETIVSLFKAIYSQIEGDLPDQFVAQLSESHKTTVEKPEKSFLRTLMGHDLSEEAIDELAVQFGKLVPSGKLSPAQIQGYLMRFKNNPHDAVEKASEWVIAQLAELKTNNNDDLMTTSNK